MFEPLEKIKHSQHAVGDEVWCQGTVSQARMLPKKTPHPNLCRWTRFKLADPIPGASRHSHRNMQRDATVSTTCGARRKARWLHAMVIAAITGPDRLCSIGGKNDHVPFFTSKRSDVFKYSRPS
mmetsp:Transcript_34085/g.90876  ORF Transcript_34085/g.90876 Transcript_34085/m.90876 type:complete len:124 (-) Transcript_34085:1399-1770(-)